MRTMHAFDAMQRGAGHSVSVHPRTCEIDLAHGDAVQRQRVLGRLEGIGVSWKKKRRSHRQASHR